MCDPSISDHLTARVLALLDRVLRHSSASGSSVHLTEDVFYQLIATGAKVKMWPGLWSRARDKTPERAGKDDEEAKLSTEQRDRVVRRLLSAIAGLAGLPSVAADLMTLPRETDSLFGSARCCDTKDAQDLVFCLLSLAIDPTSACLQESVDAALSPTLRAAMPDDAASVSCRSTWVSGISTDTALYLTTVSPRHRDLRQIQSARCPNSIGAAASSAADFTSPEAVAQKSRSCLARPAQAGEPSSRCERLEYPSFQTTTLRALLGRFRSRPPLTTSSVWHSKRQTPTLHSAFIRTWTTSACT